MLLQSVLVALFGVCVLNFILVWDLINRTKRLTELQSKTAAIIQRIVWELPNGIRN